MWPASHSEMTRCSLPATYGSAVMGLGSPTHEAYSSLFISPAGQAREQWLAQSVVAAFASAAYFAMELALSSWKWGHPWHPSFAAPPVTVCQALNAAPLGCVALQETHWTDAATDGHPPSTSAGPFPAPQYLQWAEWSSAVGHFVASPSGQLAPVLVTSRYWFELQEVQAALAEPVDHVPVGHGEH